MEQQGRLEKLSSAINDLQKLADQLPPVRGEIIALAGVSARLGLRLLDRGSQAFTVTLRRHELIEIPETLTLIRHVAGLKRGGITPPNMVDIKILLQNRKESLERALLSAEEMDMIRIEPGISLHLQETRIDIQRSIAEFKDRTGGGEGRSLDQDEEQVASGLLFGDYVSADLPEPYQQEVLAKIQKNDVLKGYTHNELIAIGKIRHIIQKIDSYGYGVASRRQPLFSQARRNVLWSAPRIGAIMVTHAQSWRRHPEIGNVLLDLRRYEQHMKDLALVPEDDDWFTQNDPLIRAVKKDSWAVHLRGVKIIADIQSGPSAYRFDEGFFDIFPGEAANYTECFLSQATPVINAMAFSGICGKAERDLALSPEKFSAEEVREDKNGGILNTLKHFFT